MNSSPHAAEPSLPAALPDARDGALRILEFLPRFRGADSTQLALELLGQVLRMIGADSAVFLSAIKDDASRTSVRLLLACDPQWAVEYSQVDWYDHDPWLRHASESQTPIRGSELQLRPSEAVFVQKSSTLGFASSIVAPAPTSFGAARFGVLILGSSSPDYCTGDSCVLAPIVARSIAMELHEWLLRVVRDDLMERSQLTAGEIDLLRHEAAGHTSKRIGAALNIEAKTVDCRFQKLSAKLNAPDRRTAARIARLYDLL